MKTYQAWTEKKEGGEQVYTEWQANNAREARAKIGEMGRRIVGKLFRKYNR